MRIANGSLFLASLLGPALLLSSAQNAHAEERPLHLTKWVSPEYVSEPSVHTSKIIFLNRCLGGCTLTYGQPGDSRTNRTFVINRQQAILSPWNKGDEEWEALVECVKAMYDPYDLEITDVDPGPNTPHFEAIVAGTAAEAGLDSRVGGIAPFGCGVVNNAVSLSFANASFYRNGIRGICETVAQETAHAFGLEHEYLCSDPMTYLDDCGPKFFQDQTVACGEYQPEGCRCGGQQNSHQKILSHFGAGDAPGPKLDFVRPADRSNVEDGFIIEVSDNDYHFGAQNIEVFVDGQSLGVSNSAPYIFNSPGGLEGKTTLEVKATDIRGYTNSKIIEVNVGDPCTPGSCEAGRVCYKEFCIPDSSNEGGFAASCDGNGDCDSELCAKDGDGNGTCTEVCELNNGDCPAGFGCTSAGGQNVCWPGISEDSGCGCQSGSNTSSLAGLLLFAAVIIPGFRRRKRRG